MYLVLIETLSNQKHIFSSNRLREMMGASEQVRQVGQVWSGQSAATIRSGALATILETSGKAIFLAENEAAATALVTAVTCRALEDAPGLGVMGAIVEIELKGTPSAFDGTADVFHKALGEVHKKLRTFKSASPPPTAHLLRLPFTEDCHSTGAGACGMDSEDPAFKYEGQIHVFSASSLKKREFLAGAYKQLHSILGMKFDKLHFYDWQNAKPRDDKQKIDPVENWDSMWRAVVHADGNGLGQVFLRFGEAAEHLKETSAANYAALYRQFSTELDEANKAAVQASVQAAWPEYAPGGGKDSVLVPFKPLVLAGDDLTAVCDGSRAVDFAQKFIVAFRKETKEKKTIARVFNAIAEMDAKKQRASPVPFEGITSGAGIAIVKPHHPFHRAYELCAALANSAKGEEPKDEGLCAIDFHVSYDGNSDLTVIRQNAPELFHGGPYVFGGQSKRLAAFDDLQTLAIDMKSGKLGPAEGPEKLGRSQLHALRDSIHQGRAVASAAEKRIKSRIGDVPGLFPIFTDFTTKDGMHQYRTTLLDAMSLADVMSLPELPASSGGDQ